jgi:hypothetical protein
MQRGYENIINLPNTTGNKLNQDQNFDEKNTLFRNHLMAFGKCIHFLNCFLLENINLQINSIRSRIKMK